MQRATLKRGIKRATAHWVSPGTSWAPWENMGVTGFHGRNGNSWAVWENVGAGGALSVVYARQTGLERGFWCFHRPNTPSAPNHFGKFFGFWPRFRVIFVKPSWNKRGTAVNSRRLCDPLWEFVALFWNFLGVYILCNLRFFHPQIVIVNRISQGIGAPIPIFARVVHKKQLRPMYSHSIPCSSNGTKSTGHQTTPTND